VRAIHSRPGLPPLAAACVAGCLLCVTAGAAPQTPQPARAAPTTRPAAAPATGPATRPATQAVPVRSEIGQSLIRRDTVRPDTTRSAAPPQPAAPEFNAPKVAGALALVLGLIFVLYRLLRRSVNGAALPGATNAVQVLTRTPLSPRQQVLLLRVGRRMLVVADCNGQLSSLCEIQDADEVAALAGQLRDEKLTSASNAFGNLLGRWRRAAGDDEDAEEFPRAAPDVPQRPAGEDGNADAQGVDDPGVASARTEIHGLTERVRLLSHQFKRT